MKLIKEHIVDFQLEHLPGFADFLLSERLHDFVRTLYRIGYQLDIPLLKYFAGMSEDEIIRISTEGNILLLTAIRNKSISDYIEVSRDNWVRNRLPVFSKTDVIAEDISLINFARKRAFREFLPVYTSDVTILLKLVDEIDRFILALELALFETYISIQHERLNESNSQLKRREEELLEAQDLGKIGSFEWDLTGNGNSSFTPEVFKIFEFEETSNLETFLNDVHPDDRLKLRAAIEKSVHDGTYECEYRYNRNGKPKILSSRGRVIFDQGAPVRMVGTVTDITEKASLIASLKENEELSKQAQALTNTGTWKWTIDGDTIEWSDEMFRIYGLQPQSEKITFERFLTFIHEDDRSRRIAEITEAVKTGVASDYVMKINSADGCRKVLKGRGRVIKDKAGKSVGMLGTCQDITNEFNLTAELKRKNEELERKNKHLESFNFIASHDLQEPLRKIQTFSNRLQHEADGTIPEHLLNYLSKISYSSNRMQKMIEDFLIFYHSINNADEIENLSLDSVVREAWLSLSGADGFSDAQIAIGKLPEVKAIRGQLIQTFRHLLSNALKFKKKNTPVRIDIASSIKRHRDQDYIVISVGDNGVGFDEKYSKRIFDLFQKLHSKDEYPGSGIGLSLCKTIVEEHGGWISVTSQPGSGSTFEVCLPAK